MEEAHGRIATTSPKIRTGSDLVEANTESEDPNRRRHAASIPITDTAAEPISWNNSFELEPIPHPPEQNAEVSTIAAKVSRSRRRGLFAQTTFLAEIEDAYQFPCKTKWFIVMVVAYAAAAAPLGSTILFRMSKSISL